VAFEHTLIPEFQQIALAIADADPLTLRHRADEAEGLVLSCVRRNDPLPDIGASVALVTDALVRRHIADGRAELASAGLQSPNGSFCWLALGSDGRKEQLLRTDQDTALVYADPEPGREEEERDFYRKLGDYVTRGLEADGYSLCPGDVMARNPKWCQPMTMWMGYFHEWIHNPVREALMNEGIVFDFRPVAGDVSLARQLRERISSGIADDKTSIVLQAQQVVQTPPARGWFRRLTVESHGPNKSLFDIKRRAMKPLTDGIRVLALDAGVHAFTSTEERIHALAEKDATIRQMKASLLNAHQSLMRCRLTFGAREHDGGRYIRVRDMGATELHQLHSALDAIKELQLVIRVRYQLEALGLT
jgi:CBS domain-containing protein